MDRPIPAVSASRFGGGPGPIPDMKHLRSCSPPPANQTPISMATVTPVSMKSRLVTVESTGSSSGGSSRRQSIVEPMPKVREANGIRQVVELMSSMNDQVARLVAATQAASESIDATTRLHNSGYTDRSFQIKDDFLDIVSNSVQRLVMDLGSMAEIPEISDALMETATLDIPSSIEKALDTIALRLEPRGVEVTSLIRLPRLNHTVETVPYVFREAVDALLAEAGNFLGKCTRRAQLTIVGEIADRKQNALDTKPQPQYVLVRVLTTGVKVLPSALENLFRQTECKEKSKIAEAANMLRGIGGAVGASTDGDRVEFWCTVPDQESPITPQPSPERSRNPPWTPNNGIRIVPKLPKFPMDGSLPTSPTNLSPPLPSSPLAASPPLIEIKTDNVHTQSQSRPDIPRILNENGSCKTHTEGYPKEDEKQLPFMVPLPSKPVADNTSNPHGKGRIDELGSGTTENGQGTPVFMPSTPGPTLPTFQLSTPTDFNPHGPGPAMPTFQLSIPKANKEPKSNPAVFTPSTAPPPVPIFKLTIPTNVGANGSNKSDKVKNLQTITFNSVAPDKLNSSSELNGSSEENNKQESCNRDINELSSSASLLNGQKLPRRGSAGNRHGRANEKHAHKAAIELGLAPDNWGVMNQSANVVECRPHSIEYKPQLVDSLSWESPFEHCARPELYQNALALLILPQVGSVAAASEYMTQWGIKYESAKTLKEGIVRFKERLEKLKQTGRGSRESIVIVDVDGNERIPEAMLKRKNIRFIFICSKSLKQQFFHRNPDDNPHGQFWFENAYHFSLVTKPIKRSDLRKAMTIERQRGIRIQPQQTDVPPPLYKSPHVNRRSQHLEQSTSGQVDENCFVLLADDTETNIFVARSYFENMSITPPHCVRDGQECIDAFIKDRNGPCQFKGILMDCLMPKVSGFQATQAIRKFEREKGLDPIPIIAMTGLAGDPELKTYLDAGTMTDHLVKPFGKQELVNKVKLFQPHSVGSN